MKCVVNVKCGLHSICRIYDGTQLVWEKQPKKQVVVSSYDDIKIGSETTIYPEAVIATESSMISTASTSAKAPPELIYCSNTLARSLENINAVVTPEPVKPDDIKSIEYINIVSKVDGESISPTLVNLIDNHKIIACASPTTNVVFANGITTILTIDKDHAKSDAVAPAFSTDRVCIKGNSSAKSDKISQANSVNSINIKNVVYAKNSDVNSLYTSANIKTAIRGSSDDSIMHYASAHDKIKTNSISKGNSDTSEKLYTYSFVKDSALLSNTSNITNDVTVHGDINTDTIATVGHNDVSLVQSHSSIDVDAIISAMTWSYPILEGNTLTIVQAYTINDDNIPILEVI